MLKFCKKFAKDEFSQNGEDGLIAEITGRMGIEKGSVVEFGAHNGVFCSNSRALILKGWKALLIEGDPNLYRQLYALYKRPSEIGFDSPSHRIYDVAVHNAMVTAGNVNNILPRDIDVLSIDVDGIDYDIWKAWTGSAKMVIIEINSSLDPMSVLAGDPGRGSSYLSMVDLAENKGYKLICHCGNLVFIQKGYLDLFPELEGTDAIIDLKEYFNTSWQNS